MRLPAREEYPDYYKIIKQPMDMTTVHRNILSGKTYLTWQQFEADMQLIFSNARSYNRPGSEIYENATTLSALLRRLRPDEEKARLLEVERLERETRNAAKKALNRQAQEL